MIHFVTIAGGPAYVAAAQRLEGSLGEFCRFAYSFAYLFRGNEPVSPLHKPALILARARIPAEDFLYYIDADMRAVALLEENELLPGPDAHLAAVRHFYNDNQAMALPAPNRNCFPKPQWHEYPYWQTCLFGGEVNAMRRLCEDTHRRIISDCDHSGAWEEPYLNYCLCERIDFVRTLPVTYAAPAAFPWGEKYAAAYSNRAGGLPPKIMHGNYHHAGNRAEEL